MGLLSIYCTYSMTDDQDIKSARHSSGQQSYERSCLPRAEIKSQCKLTIVLGRLVQIILNLLRRQQSEHSILRTNNSHLNVMRGHFSFESLTKRQQCGMNGIFQFHVVLVSLLQKVFGVDVILCGADWETTTRT